MGNRTRSSETHDVQIFNKSVRVVRQKLHRNVMQLWLYEDSWETLKLLKADELKFFILMIMLFLKGDNGLIEMGSREQDTLEKKLEISKPTLFRRLKCCISADVITRESRGVYLVNSNVVTVGKDYRDSGGVVSRNASRQ